MIDKTDYVEPQCPLCDGAEFYYPDADAPKGTIPIKSVLAKVDASYDTNDYAESERLLEYWENEGKELGDDHGLVSIYGEQMGLYRKIGNAEKGIKSAENGLALLKKLRLEGSVSGATIMLDAATTLQAFGKNKEAAELFAKAEKIYNEKLEGPDFKKAGLCNNAALCYVALGELEKAENYYKKALGILKQNEGYENEIAVTYINLAHLLNRYEDQRLKETYECMDKALEALNAQTKQDGYYAFTLEKCVPSFSFFGYFFAEEKFTEKIKEIRERIKGN